MKKKNTWLVTTAWCLAFNEILKGLASCFFLVVKLGEKSFKSPLKNFRAVPA
jgi:hypothetical protein